MKDESVYRTLDKLLEKYIERVDTPMKTKQSKYNEYRKKAELFDRLLFMIEAGHSRADYLVIPVNGKEKIVQMNTDPDGRKFFFIR